MPYKDAEKRRACTRKWNHKHPECFRAMASEIKIEVLSYYGKNKKLQCCWPGCEIDDIDLLTLDHINDDGYLDKGSTGRKRGGHGLYRRLRRIGFPSGFQTLCANHQLKKEILRRRANAS
jgi:hypothetical protein